MPDKAIKDVTSQPAPPADSDFVLWGAAAGAGLGYKMTFTQLKSKLDSMGGAVAPTLVSATCPNGAPGTLVLVFSQSMTAVTVAGWSAKKNGSAWSISSVTGSGTTWTLTMGSSAVFGDVLLISYDSTTGATIGTSLELVSFTDTSVTNSVAGGDVTAPTVVMAYMLNSTTIRYIYDESVTMTLAGHSWLKNAVAWTSSSISGSGTTWDVVMGSAYTEGDTLLRSYNSASGATVDTAANELVSYTDQGVWETKTGAFLLQSTGQTYNMQSRLDAMCKAAIGIGWTKFKDIKPIAGTTAAQHKWNFVDPQDTDAAHRWVFNGSIFHAADGIDSSGGSGDYIDGKFNPFSVYGSSHLQSYGIYLREALPDGKSAFGVTDGTYCNFMTRVNPDSYMCIGLPLTGISPATAAPAAWTGHLSMSREGTGAGTCSHYLNGVYYGGDGDVFYGIPNANLLIKARNNNGTIDTNSLGRIAFWWAATDLDATEMATWDAAIQAYLA